MSADRLAFEGAEEDGRIATSNVRSDSLAGTLWLPPRFRDVRETRARAARNAGKVVGRFPSGQGWPARLPAARISLKRLATTGGCPCGIETALFLTAAGSGPSCRRPPSSGRVSWVETGLRDGHWSQVHANKGGQGVKVALFSWETLHSIAVGGVGVHVTELAAALERRGHEVHIFTRLGNGQPLYDDIHGVHYHRVPFSLHPSFVDEINNMCRA